MILFCYVCHHIVEFFRTEERTQIALFNINISLSPPVLLHINQIPLANHTDQILK